VPAVRPPDARPRRLGAPARVGLPRARAGARPARPRRRAAPPDRRGGVVVLVRRGGGVLVRRLALALLLLATGCTAVPPGPLEEDPRWQDVMRRGHLASRGTLYVEPPRLEQPSGLALAEAAPVTVDDDGHATLWPERLPGGFAQELRELLKLNT